MNKNKWINTTINYFPAYVAAPWNSSFFIATTIQNLSSETKFFLLRTPLAEKKHHRVRAHVKNTCNGVMIRFADERV